MSHIPLTDCIAGHLYEIDSRNLGLGVFNGKTGFIGIRYKFGSRYLFTKYHFDKGPPYGTVHPIKDLGPIPDGIPLTENLHHEHGDSWSRRGEEIVPVIRRNLEPGEEPHGSRRGFVDLWADTNERMPDNEYPGYRSNQQLFEFLDRYAKNANQD